jgi:hypothetical protein
VEYGLRDAELKAEFAAQLSVLMNKYQKTDLAQS